MTNKQFIKQNVHFNSKNKKETNVVVRIFKVIEDICGLLAAICWIILLGFIALLTLGQGFGSGHSNRVKNKYGQTIYK
jgi:hypothetical protein|tara:strand:- start:93 stop:326 length:234 start_codon:yes stop_codon:yes gene_type:complete